MTSPITRDEPTDSTFKLGIDVGGTFTDFVLADFEGGRLRSHKRLTTPDDPARAILAGVKELLAAGGNGRAPVAVHGTTLVSNAIIERRGARVALVTTEGAKDVLTLGTENRYDINDRLPKRPAPLVARAAIAEVAERITADGAIREALNEEEIERIVEWLRAQEVDAVAISLLHAYRTGIHERLLADAIETALELPVTQSHELAAEIREYPRTSTAVANAYVQPLMRRYLTALAADLQRIDEGFSLYVMLSDGGVATADTAARFPIRLVESGAAGGVQAAAHYGALFGERRLVSFDMGGTTAKLSVLDDAEPVRTSSVEVARIRRFKKGSGFPLLMPVVELLEIGAGGGSIASIDALGLLKVGPRSAGAAPGPACYGQGGSEPTVTDAALTLGYLDADFFLGGAMPLDPTRGVTAIGTVANELDISIDAAALGILRVATENMAAAARVYLSEMGRDVRDYSLIAFGGAGPMLACSLARALGITRVLIPPEAGTASALGFVSAATAFESSRTYLSTLGRLDADALHGVLEEMQAENLDALRDAGVTQGNSRTETWVDMRYEAQTHEVEVPISPDHLDAASLRVAFEQEYASLYDRTLESRELELVRCRVRTTLLGSRPQGAFEEESADRPPRPAQRSLAFAEGRFEGAVHGRSSLRVGEPVAGPAVIEDVSSTTVVEPHVSAVIDEHGCLELTLKGGV
jgi:5-oxoprolinase (ATP-hydrolysing)